MYTRFRRWDESRNNVDFVWCDAHRHNHHHYNIQPNAYIYKLKKL
jgi:hypothetical protein